MSGITIEHDSPAAVFVHILRMPNEPKVKGPTRGQQVLHEALQIRLRELYDSGVQSDKAADALYEDIMKSWPEYFR